MFMIESVDFFKVLVIVDTLNKNVLVIEKNGIYLLIFYKYVNG
jgi:hypothetical protein